MAPTTARRVGFTAVTLLLVLLVFPLGAPVGAQGPVPQFRITGLKAMLFYGQTGMFSADLFGSSGPKLQNVTTGPGQSTATLVVVEITGQSDSYALPAK